mgnify:CR=1 FL=1
MEMSAEEIKQFWRGFQIGCYTCHDGPSAEGASGNRAAVVLDGDYITTEIIQVVASGITIADLTLRARATSSFCGGRSPNGVSPVSTS